MNKLNAIFYSFFSLLIFTMQQASPLHIKQICNLSPKPVTITYRQPKPAEQMATLEEDVIILQEREIIILGEEEITIEVPAETTIDVDFTLPDNETILQNSTLDKAQHYLTICTCQATFYCIEGKLVTKDIQEYIECGAWIQKRPSQKSLRKTLGCQTPIRRFAYYGTRYPVGTNLETILMEQKQELPKPSIVLRIDTKGAVS